MSGNSDHENTRGAAGGPLSEDLHPTIVYSPPDYEARCSGPVKYVLIGNPLGVVGFLWASDAEGAAGMDAISEQGDAAVNSESYWMWRGRDAYSRGLSPTEFLAHAQEAGLGAWLYPGRVIAGTEGEAPSKDALREQLATPGGVPLNRRTLFSHHFPVFRRGQGFTVDVTDEMRKTAELAKPDAGERTWFVVDQQYPLYEKSRIPVEGLIGRWQILPDGSLTEFEANPQWQPSPAGMGFRYPENDLENKFMLLKAGRLTAADFLAVLRRSTVCCAFTDDNRPRVIDYKNAEYQQVLEIATSRQYVPDDWPGTGTGTVDQLLGQAPAAQWVSINRGFRPSVVIPVSDISMGVFG